jgi:hypothetical protein
VPGRSALGEEEEVEKREKRGWAGSDPVAVSPASSAGLSLPEESEEGEEEEPTSS